MKINLYTALLLKKLVLVLLGITLFAGVGLSQDDPVMKFVGKIKDEKGKPLSGATIRVLQNGKEVHTATTNASGEFTPYSGYYGYVYQIEVIKGDYTKNTFEINSKNYDDELLEAEVSISIKSKLVKKNEGTDYGVVENKPIEKFSIDKNTGQITFNKNYADSRKSEIKKYFDKLKGDEKDKEKRFKALVKSGDGAFSKKDYGKAIADWKAALELKDDDALAEKLTDAEIKYEDELEAKEKEAKMNKLIQEGDNLAGLLKFENAKEKYESAQIVNPDSKLPKQKLKELQKKIDNQASEKADKQYKELIARADIKTKSGSFDEAKKLLGDAQKVKPKEKEPAKKIKEIDKLIKALAKNKANYDKLIIEADAFLASKNYEKSKIKYQAASELISSEEYPKTKLKEIESILADLKKKEEEYKKLMASADKEFKDKQYETSIASYEQASKLKPEESLPKEQITKAKQALAELKKAEEDYANYMTSADKDFNAKSYEKAIENYEKALKVKPKESKPAEQIKKAKDEIAKAKKAEEDYNRAIAAGDKSFGEEQYENAIKEYEKALAIKPSEAKPTEQISKAKEALAALKQKEEDYKTNMAAADKAFKEKQFETAISSYEKASTIKPEETLPKEQITKAKAEIEKIKEQEEEFKTLVAQADKEFSDNSFEEAINTYKKALLIKPDESRVKEQIDKANKEIEAIKKREADYAAAMAKAETDFQASKFTEAISNYEAALKLKPTESLPKEGIEKAKAGIEAERIAKEKAEADRLAKEKAEAERIAKEKAEADRLAKEKAEADRLAKEKAEADRLAKEKAEADRLAKEKAEADRLAKEKAEADRLAKEKAEADRLAKEKAEADRLAKEKAEADRLAKEKAEADRLAKEKAEADRLAKEKAEADRLAKEKAEADRLAKEKAEADRLAKEKAEADRLAKEKAEADRLAKEKAEADRLAKEKAEADRLAKEKAEAERIAKAKAEADRLAKEKAEADRLAKEKAEADRLAREKARADRLAKEKAEADRLAKQKAEADRLAKEKAEADRLAQEKARLARENAIKEAEEKARLEAEKARLAAEQARDKEKNKRYISLIDKADEQFNDKNYRSAKNTYNSALAVKPNEQYPKDKINTINELLEKMSEEERNTIASTDDYFNIDAELYGEEVDMSTSDGSILLTRIEDNSDLREYEDLKRFIDSTIQNDKKSALRDENFSLLTYQKFEELKDKITQETGSNDYGRNGSIASINLYLNAYLEDRNIESTDETSDNLVNYQALEKLNDKFIENNYEQYRRNNGLGAEYQKYTDRNTELAQAQNFDHLKTNSEVYAELERFKDKLTDEQLEKATFYKENNENYDALKDKLYEDKITLVDKEKLSRKNERDYLEKTQEIIKKKEEEGVKKIGTHNKEYIEYADKISDLNTQLGKDETVQINTTKEELDKLADKRIEENEAGQKKIEGNAKLYDEFNDKLSEQKEALSNSDKKSQEKINAYLEKTNDKIVDDRRAGQEKIGNKSVEYDSYIDKLSDLNNKKSQENTSKTQQTANEIEKLGDKKTEENEALVKKNGTKGENLDRYRDSMAIVNEEAAQGNTEKTLKNSQKYSKIKDNLNVQKSDEVKDELALLFPQGVTQKVYQKKNSYGEVIAVTVRRVVIKGNKGDDYIHKKTKAGDFYFKNGKSISESTWDLETSGEIVNK